MNPFQNSRRKLLVLPAIFWLGACNKAPKTGPVDVRWDRETCERCMMSISDPNFAAQVRGGPPGKPQILHKFDDLGCAIIWLDQQSWKDNPQTEVWVGQYKTGKWINAKTAHYVKNQLTPMNYGLGAQAEDAPGAINFAEARQHIYKIENELNLHGGTLHQTPLLNPEPPTKQAN